MCFIANTKNSRVTLPVASMVDINSPEEWAKYDFGKYRKACDIFILNHFVLFKQNEIEKYLMDIRFLTAPHLLQTPGYIQVANVRTGNLAVSELCY